MKKLTLSVSGMHCKSCPELIKDMLSETDGVKSVDVSLEKSSAIVNYDEKKLSENKIIDVIKQAGYQSRKVSQ